MVKFQRNHGSYNANEVARFSEAHETWLVSRRIAVPYKPKEGMMAKSAGDEKKEPEKKDPAEKDPGKPQTRQTTVGPQTR